VWPQGTESGRPAFIQGIPVPPVPSEEGVHYFSLMKSEHRHCYLRLHNAWTNIVFVGFGLGYGVRDTVGVADVKLAFIKRFSTQAACRVLWKFDALVFVPTIA
jgi:hypothetical protein